MMAPTRSPVWTGVGKVTTVAVDAPLFGSTSATNRNARLKEPGDGAFAGQAEVFCGGASLLLPLLAPLLPPPRLLLLQAVNIRQIAIATAI
jgi:hypothetical protein